MNRRVLEEKFRRMYPGASRRSIEDLVNALVEDKYWRSGQLLFCIAATRARYRDRLGRFCRCSGLGRVYVPEDLAGYVRRGIVLAVRGRVAVSAMGWDAFVWLVRRGIEGAVAERGGFVSLGAAKKIARSM